MPEEIEEVLEAYELEQVGENLYHQRKYIAEFLNGLPMILEKQSLHFGNDFDFFESFRAERKIMTGRLNIKQTVFQIMKDVYSGSGNMKICLPPACDELLDVLELFGGADSEIRCRIVHIVAMELDQNYSMKQNLKQITNIMKCCNIVPDYHALYYYGRTVGRPEVMSVLPGLIITEKAALQISADCQKCIVYTDESEIALFSDLFHGLEQQCRTLMHYQTGTENVINLCFRSFQDRNFEDTMELCQGMCSMQFWTEELVRKYLNRKMPEFDKTASGIGFYCSYMYEKKRKGHTKVIMNSEGILEFIRTGIFCEYPENYFESPLSIEDREMILNRIFSACKEGWYEFCIADSMKFPLLGNWEIMVNRREQITIQGFSGDACKAFVYTESGIVEAVYDYLEYFCSSGFVISPEDSVEQVKTWMKMYLRSE